MKKIEITGVAVAGSLAEIMDFSKEGSIRHLHQQDGVFYATLDMEGWVLGTHYQQGVVVSARNNRENSLFTLPWVYREGVDSQRVSHWGGSSVCRHNWAHLRRATLNDLVYLDEEVEKGFYTPNHQEGFESHPDTGTRWKPGPSHTRWWYPVGY